MRHISVKAVVVGGVLDLAFSFLSGIVVMAVAGLRADIFSLPPEQQEAALLAVAQSALDLALVSIAAGSAMSVLAGYVTGRLAPQAPVLNAALASLPCALLGLYGIVNGMPPLPRWAAVLLLPLGPALTSLGGWLSYRGRLNDLAGTAPSVGEA